MTTRYLSLPLACLGLFVVTTVASAQGNKGKPTTPAPPTSFLIVDSSATPKQIGIPYNGADAVLMATAAGRPFVVNLNRNEFRRRTSFDAWYYQSTDCTGSVYVPGHLGPLTQMAPLAMVEDNIARVPRDSIAGTGASLGLQSVSNSQGCGAWDGSQATTPMVETIEVDLSGFIAPFRVQFR